MFLWIIFSFLSALLNCDLQRFLRLNPLILHLFGLIAFFFLFTLLDYKSTASIYVTWFKTFFIYILFILMTKSKWYFVIPVLSLLLIDQCIKKQTAYDKDQGNEDIRKLISKIINISSITLIIIGTIHYMYLQKVEYQKEFSLFKFFLVLLNVKNMIQNMRKILN